VSSETATKAAMAHASRQVGPTPSPTSAVDTAADVAAWRRKYYPDGVQSAVRRAAHDASSALENADIAEAPPPCERCCCRCCCSAECIALARHKPAASPDCLWWYA